MFKILQWGILIRQQRLSAICRVKKLTNLCPVNKAFLLCNVEVKHSNSRPKMFMLNVMNCLSMILEDKGISLTILEY